MVGNAVFLIKIGGWKDFMFRDDKFLGFEHPYNLLYFENKGIDSSNTFRGYFLAKTESDAALDDFFKNLFYHTQNSF